MSITFTTIDFNTSKNADFYLLNERDLIAVQQSFESGFGAILYLNNGKKVKVRENYQEIIDALQEVLDKSKVIDNV